MFGHGTGEKRDKGGAECALGEEAAEQVGQTLRHKKGVSHRSGTKNGGRQDIANKAKNAAQQGVGADRRD